MVRAEDRTPEAIHAALEDLVRHEGWKILGELVDQQFGDAALVRQFRASLASMSAADRAEQRESYAILQAASDAAKSVLDLPHSKMRAIAESKPPAVTFDKFRRGPRHA